MGLCVNVIALFATVFCFSIRAAKLPSAFGRCSVKDPEIDECLRKNVEGAIHFLKAGSPELGFDTFDPLHIPELVIGEGKGPVNVVQHFRDVDLYGLTESIVHEVHMDQDKKMMTARSTTPELRLQGKYTVKGKVLLLPIVGDGLFNVTLINTKINHTIMAESFEKKGNNYWKIKSYTVTLRPERMLYKFDNLFDGDERLGAELNKVLNENWDAVFNDVRDGYEESFGIIFHGLANRVFTRVALKDIFLDFE
ncbi:protein takeout [Leptinotarsa decemlineata]|uniref:protein takeout n=1 Tax=Leptinotarsa decemlineata TaxID=7539 RepID=UPI000C2529D1|nr:protein takeout-like [Leptinotarsa decemlineata]